MGVTSYLQYKSFSIFCYIHPTIVSYYCIILLYTDNSNKMSSEIYNNLEKRTVVLEKLLIDKENNKNITITNTQYDLQQYYALQTWKNLLTVIYIFILLILIYLFVYVQLDMKLYKKILIVLACSIVPFFFQIYDGIIYYTE